MGLFQRLLEQRAFAAVRPRHQAPAKTAKKIKAATDRVVSRETVSPPTPAAAVDPERVARRSLIAGELLARGVAVERVPALLESLEARGLQAFEAQLAATVEIPRMARETAGRIESDGNFCFLDPQSFAEQHIAAGSSLAHVAELLADICERESVPLPSYERRFGNAALEAEQAKIAAKVNAEADALEASWSASAPAKTAEAAPAGPQHLGYFRLDAVPGFRPPLEDTAP